jgi:hypothetical protein
VNSVPLLFHDLHRLRSQSIPEKNVFEVTLILKDAFSKRGGRRGEEKGDQVGGGKRGTASEARPGQRLIPTSLRKLFPGAVPATHQLRGFCVDV